MPTPSGDPGSPRTAWTNAFRGAGGVLAGGAVATFGDAGRLRVELEYFFREAAHNETSPVQGRGGVTVAKLDGEVVSAEDRIGSVTAHGLFANVQLDLASRHRARGELFQNWLGGTTPRPRSARHGPLNAPTASAGDRSVPSARPYTMASICSQ